MVMLTVPPYHHWGWRAEHCWVGHHVSHCACVVPRIRCFNFGYVQISRLLRNETTSILLQEAALSIENPWIFDLWNNGNRTWNADRHKRNKLSSHIYKIPRTARPLMPNTYKDNLRTKVQAHPHITLTVWELLGHGHPRYKVLVLILMPEEIWSSALIESSWDWPLLRTIIINY